MGSVLRGIVVSLVLFLALTARGTSSEPPSWDELALRLTGESDRVRSQSLERLRAIPDLETKLREGLRGAKRHLALDVIGALSLESLLPDLLSLSPEDETGFVHLGINALMSPRTASRILGHYRSEIESLKGMLLPMTVQVILLDELGRAGVLLDPALLMRRLDWAGHEVQSATVAYARRLINRHDRLEYLPVLEAAAKGKVWQLRAEALIALGNLRSPRAKVSDQVWKRCLTDFVPPVRALCAEKGKVAP